MRKLKFAEGGGVKNFKPQTRAPKGALCACGDALGPHFLAADGGSVPESRAPWAPQPGFTDPTWGRVWEEIKSQGPEAVKAWFRKQAEYMARRAAPYYGGQRGVNGAANLKEQLDMLAGTARGATAATLGLPGDLQSLGRGAMSVPQGPLATLSAMQEHTLFPKSDELKKGERGFLARGAGTPGEAAGETLGDFVPLIPPSAVRSGARAVGRGVEAVGRRAERGVERALEDPGIIGDITRAAGRTFAPAPTTHAVKPKGGNFAENRLAAYLNELGAWTPEADMFGIEPRAQGPSEPVQTWMTTQLRNYLRKDLGAPTDPLLAVERESPGLHLPEGALDTGTWAADDARRLNAFLADPNRSETTVMRALAHKHRELTDQPATPWGMLSGSMLHRVDPFDYANDIGFHVGSKGTAIDVPGMLRDTFGDDVPAPLRWLEKAPPDTKIWSLTEPYQDQLGFGHVRDYLEAATEAHQGIRRAGAGLGEPYLRHGIANPNAIGNAERQEAMRWLALQDAGLTLDPASLPRLSVADAVRKTAQWNKFMSEQAAVDGPLTKGWKEFKAYPDKGMKWVEFGSPETPTDMFTLPEGYKLKPLHEQLPPGQTQAWKVVGPDGADAMPSMGWSGHGNRYSEDPIIREGGERAAIYQFNRLRGEEDLRAGLGAEGDAMGHCVGGYCDDVLTRGTKIYSLRDAKGKPHVTIEVRPPNEHPNAAFDRFAAQATPEEKKRLGDAYAVYKAAQDAAGNGAMGIAQFAHSRKLIPPPPPEIIQIKGKGNAAPVADYLPFVQDFVRSGKWGRVGDLGNTGLEDVTNLTRDAAEQRLMFHPFEDVTIAEVNRWRDANPQARYLSAEDLSKFLGREVRAGRRGVRYASGGSVEKDPEGFLPRNIDEATDYVLRVFGKQ